HHVLSSVSAGHSHSRTLWSTRRSTMTSSDTIACSLEDAELKERLDHLRTGLFSRTNAVQKEGNGFRFSFDASDDRVASVLEFIRLERECCPFLTFRLTVPPSPQAVILHMN